LFPGFASVGKTKPIADLPSMEIMMRSTIRSDEKHIKIYCRKEFKTAKPGFGRSVTVRILTLQRKLLHLYFAMSHVANANYTLHFEITITFSLEKYATPHFRKF